MSIFRRRGSRHEDEAAPADTAVDANALHDADAFAEHETDAEHDADAGPDAEHDADEGPVQEAAAGGAAAQPVTADQGPYDISEADPQQERLDLGALQVVGVAGMELRLEVEEATQSIVGATAVLGDSAVQLQAFAAPRSSGLWDEIRQEIADSIVGQGGTAEEARGPLGVELRTRMPSAGPDGRTVFAPARFTGVDGPRWFLRGVFSGRAAIDDQAAQPLLQVLRSTVVVRGDAAMAPRELLPLRLPEAAAGSEEEPADAPAGRSADDLRPFERGPEITEIR